MTNSPETLRAAIEASGLSARRFAVEVMGRDERTVRRWLSGETEIPDSAAQWLLRIERVFTDRDGSRLTVRLRV